MMLLLLAALNLAQAGELAGVKVPDQVTVGGQQLALNGMGLREKIVIDVYVGSLYLPQKTSQASKAVDADVPKRIQLNFIYETVTVEQQKEAFSEAMAKLPNAAAVADRMTRLATSMELVHSGDEVVFDYVPGKGTQVKVKGKDKGTIEGADFMRALWTIYLGPNPPSESLKKGMLGL
jgi:hypothetical protein